MEEFQKTHKNCHSKVECHDIKAQHRVQQGMQIVLILLHIILCKSWGKIEQPFSMPE